MTIKGQGHWVRCVTPGSGLTCRVCGSTKTEGFRFFPERTPLTSTIFVCACCAGEGTL